MTVQAYEKLAPGIQGRIEASPSLPSSKSLIYKIVLSLLLPAGAPLALFTSLGKTRVIDLTRLGDKTKIGIIVFVAKVALISLFYNILKFNKQENQGRMQAIHSLISKKLGDNQYVAVRIGGTTYCINSTGVTPEDCFDKTNKTLQDVATLLK